MMNIIDDQWNGDLLQNVNSVSFIPRNVAEYHFEILKQIQENISLKLQHLNTTCLNGC